VPRTTRTVGDWVIGIDEHRLDDGSSHLSAHDLRRTWGTPLVDDEVEPGLVMGWGGWEDWETFRAAYLGTDSTKAKTRARAKVDWL
jgi:integrase